MEVTNGKQFAAYMKTVRKRTLDVISKVPQERENWRLSEDSMSVVDIVLHIAAVEKSLWGSGISQFKPGKLDEFAKDTLSLKEALDYMETTRTDSINFWENLNNDDLSKEVMTPTGDKSVLKRWLILAPEHEIHHRSFIHAYRKLWGLKSSPLYGLTYDDLRRLVNP
jgi:uncharacterized damage-inducible protein DinB